MLLVFAFIGATSAICPAKQNPPGVTTPSPYVPGGQTDIYTFEDDSCSTERTGVDGLMTTSSGWAADLGSECTPPGNGECWVLSPACEAKLATFCGSPSSFYAWKSKAPKALKVWWVDQGGKTASFPIGPVVGPVAGVFVCLILWLANCFGKPSCGEPSWMLCPSPLFKTKPSAPTSTEAPGTAPV